MRTGVFIWTSIAEMTYCLNFFKMRNLFWLCGFKSIYLLESNILNECPNIFMRRKKSGMNVWIYLLLKNPQIIEWMNIFVNKYSNIYKYPNFRYTLIHIATEFVTYIVKFCVKCTHSARCGMWMCGVGCWVSGEGCGPPIPLHWVMY